MKNTPVPMVMVDPLSGALIWQNAASMQSIGSHGLENRQRAPGQAEPSPLDYLSLLFQDRRELEEMRSIVTSGGPFTRRMQIHRFVRCGFLSECLPAVICDLKSSGRMPSLAYLAAPS